MNTESLFQVLSDMHFLSADFRQSLTAELKSVRFPKGHYLVQAQTPAHHVYFLEKGFAAGFKYWQHKRVVTAFWQPHDIIISPKSFFEQLATDEIIELTTDSELLSLSYASAIKLMKTYQVANLLTRDISIAHSEKIEERIVDLHTLEAWDRYTKLIKAYPGIELHVSQDLIASYLNITPQSLSRLKADHAK